MGAQQERIKAKLESTGLPYKNIDVYGRQIVITSCSEGTALKWASLLAKFSKVRRASFKTDDNAKIQKGTCLLPTYVPVWRTFAAIEA